MLKFWKGAYDKTALDGFAGTVLSLALVGPAFAMEGECSHDIAIMYRLVQPVQVNVLGARTNQLICSKATDDSASIAA